MNDKVIINCDEEIIKLQTQLIELNKKKLERLQELQRADLIDCDTCKQKLSQKRAIIDERCPHGNPYAPTYYKCYFCSETCQINHKNAIDTL